MSEFQIPEPDRHIWETEMSEAMGPSRVQAYEDAFAEADRLIAAHNDCGDKFQDHGEKILAFMAIREARHDFVEKLEVLGLDYITVKYQNDHPTEL